MISLTKPWFSNVHAYIFIFNALISEGACCPIYLPYRALNVQIVHVYVTIRNLHNYNYYSKIKKEQVNFDLQNLN